MILCIISHQTSTGEMFVCARPLGFIHTFRSQENAARGTVLGVDSPEPSSLMEKVKHGLYVWSPRKGCLN